MTYDIRKNDNPGLNITCQDLTPYTHMNRCPCNKTALYLECCGQYIESQADAPTPEALMRSRYTSYTQNNSEYIKKTMQGRPALAFDEKSLAKPNKNLHWLGLKVLQSSFDELDQNLGYVEFEASLIEKNILRKIHEISEFRKIENRWYYVDGEMIDTPDQKISRNDTCPCGSGHKYKNCHLIK